MDQCGMRFERGKILLDLLKYLATLSVAGLTGIATFEQQLRQLGFPVLALLIAGAMFLLCVGSASLGFWRIARNIGNIGPTTANRIDTDIRLSFLFFVSGMLAFLWGPSGKLLIDTIGQ